ncbi:MAG: cell division protein FtsZ [Sumerlaeia bacterium]
MPEFVLDDDPTGFAKIKVVGVGGGGCNAVDSMFDLGLQNVEFYVVNSDLQALKRTKCPNRIQIGAELTQGRGCGADPNLGAQCMEDARDMMVETLQGADIVFITAGLGGGTGTGAAPVCASIAKEMGILTVSVVTKPFKFEGPRRNKSATGGLDRMRDASDTVIVINNERLLDVVGPKVPMKEAFQTADRVLSQAVSSIADLVATPGLINVDFNDIRTIMGGKGGAVMGVGVGKGESRATEAVRKATSSPLLDKVVIDGATGVLICITGGPDMTLQEVSEATELVQASADPEAEIIFGAVIDESLNDTMRVTLIATGFSDELHRKRELEKAFHSAPTYPAHSQQQPNYGPAPGRQPGAQPRQESHGGYYDEPQASRAPQAPRASSSLRESFENLVEGPAFGGAKGQPAPAPKAEAPQPQVMEAPIFDEMPDVAPHQHDPSGPQIRVAPSQRTGAPNTNGTNGGPRIRPAGSSDQNHVNHGSGSSASVPQYNPDQEEQEDLDKPAFMRRNRRPRNLFD